MKILHVAPIRPTLGATGPSHSVRGLATAQAQVGLEVGLLSSFPLPSGSKMEETPGVCQLNGLHKEHYNPWCISKDWIDRIKSGFGTPDIVHFHSSYIPFHTALARQCHKLDWPYMISSRGVLGIKAQKRRRVKKAVANLLFFNSYVANAAAVHALCTREADDIQAAFKTQRFIIAPNGVDDYLLDACGELPPADLTDFTQGADLVLGFVGRIDMYHKGIDLLLKAIAILNSQSNGLRCKLFVVGPFHRDKDERSFFSTVKSLGLKDDVKLFGPKYGQEKLRYFLACDAFAHPSRFEGMPMSVLEAMALGRPCLVTPETNVADIVCQGGGWQCSLSPESIAETIKNIYEQKETLQLRGQKSHELMRNRFTWKNIAKKMTQEYEKIINLRC